MRGIKFKAIDYNDNWVYGLPYSSDYSGEVDQIVCGDTHIDVRPETVCEYAKMGVFYEGDILKIVFTEYYSNDAVTVEEDSEVVGTIGFSDGGWYVNEEDSTWYWLYDLPEVAEIEVIGNKHDRK